MTAQNLLWRGIVKIRKWVWGCCRGWGDFRGQKFLSSACLCLDWCIKRSKGKTSISKKKKKKKDDLYYRESIPTVPETDWFMANFWPPKLNCDTEIVLVTFLMNSSRLDHFFKRMKRSDLRVYPESINVHLQLTQYRIHCEHLSFLDGKTP